MYRIIYNTTEVIEITIHDDQSVTYFDTSIYSAIIDSLENAEEALIALGVNTTKITEYKQFNNL